MQEKNGTDKSENGRGAERFCALALGTCVGVIAYANLASPGVGIPGEWVWDKVREPRYSSLHWPLLMIAVLQLLLWGCCIRWKLNRPGKVAGALAGMVAALFLFQMAVGQLGQGGTVETIFANLKRANAYYAEARTVKNLSDYLAGYEEQLRDRPFRVQLSTHPPGSILYYYAFLKAAYRWPGLARAVRDFSRKLGPVPDAYEIPQIAGAMKEFGSAQNEGAAWTASFFLRFCAGLVILPLYFLCRSELTAERALSIAVLGAVTPALFLFSPHPDQLFPLLCALSFWLTCSALKNSRMGPALLAGFCLFIGLFFSMSFLVPLFLIAVWVLSFALNRKDPRIGLVVLGGLAGLAVPLVLLYFVYDYNALGVWRACIEQNDKFNADSARTYWKWLLFNPVELCVFAGAAPFLAFWRYWYCKAKDLASCRQTDSIPENEDKDCGERNARVARDSASKAPLLDGLLLSLGLTVLLLDLSGKNLGEVGRLWMLFMPAMSLSLVGCFKRWKPKDEGCFFALVFIQCVQLVGLRLSVDALGLFFSQ